LKMKFSFQAAAVRVLGAAIVGTSLAMLVSCSTATSGTPAAGEAIAAPSHSYIVEARSTDDAASAVLAAGGEVVSRLNVIDAVEARLTDAQHARVVAAGGIRQVTTNATI